MKSLLLIFVSFIVATPLSFSNPNQAPLRNKQVAPKYLIELAPDTTRWVTEDEKWALRREGSNFMDITYGTPGEGAFDVAQKAITKYPDKTQYNRTLQSLIQDLSKDEMRTNLQRFSAFHTRYYKSNYGAQSSEWLFDKVKKVIDDSGADKYGTTIRKFEHPWGQNSIIANIPGRTNKTIVIGAHQDSINLFFPSLFAAPGADDDGSGTVTILEALRVLLKSDEITRGNGANTVEFQWYSAEEGGLLGSQAIFREYERQGRDVKAMLQQDMTGYTADTVAAGKPESVGIITDFVDPRLTRFIKEIVTTYCNIPFILTKCGYACSDHASASKAGYPSAFVIESEFKYVNKRIHTTQDTIDSLDFNHMLQHAKLTLATAYELAFNSFD